MEKEIHYKNEDITIVWKPDLCTHSGFCVRTLPKVYKPKARPWVTIENASTEELKHQISKCPSRALSFIED
ncbi:MAG: (4Fe-4S)-binding protein [Vicingaceae bacterium]|nr:(4Fe-4S)-binding protein [Vicingaceae bacterium]